MKTTPLMIGLFVALIFTLKSAAAGTSLEFPTQNFGFPATTLSDFAGENLPPTLSVEAVTARRADPPAESKSSDEKFVIKPGSSVDYKLLIKQPDLSVNYRMVVKNPEDGSKK